AATGGALRFATPPGVGGSMELVLSGFAVGITPWIFYVFTGGLEPVGAGKAWTGYVLSVFGSAAAVVLLPGIIIGSVFPYLMKLAEPYSRSAGRTIGHLAAINTVSAIAGSLVAGFVLLDLVGLWGSIRAVGIAYLLLAVVVPGGRTNGQLAARGAAAVGVVLFGFVITYAGFSKVRLDAGSAEQVVEIREGSQGTVAVLNRDGDLRMKVNNSYLLGTSESAPNTRIQTWLPIGLHPRPRSIFFLGMGTGITAGAALALPVERVVVCELNRDVVEASRDHFEPYLFGLFRDPRATVLVEDGRNYLYGTRETFDLIIGDIFLTYRAGVGSLYTVEHFRAVRDRLEPGGLFVQWLPTFDISPREFDIVTRTMLEAFPQVTVWRRSLSPSFPLVALVARADETPLDPGRLEGHLESLVEDGLLPQDVWLGSIPLAAYMGNAGEAASLFADVPVSTDDRTPLEFSAPITNRNSHGRGAAVVLAWEALADLGRRLLDAVPTDADPYLRNVEPAKRRQVGAGLAYYRHVVATRSDRPVEAAEHLQEYRRLLGLDPG
ncbi:MAG: fused MFS/spermidine synthase, partial [Acidobacteriota bacterium]|nr:fused MFS/spermidine synthase [Acidobacteriota bacterium]